MNFNKLISNSSSKPNINNNNMHALDEGPFSKTFGDRSGMSANGAGGHLMNLI